MSLPESNTDIEVWKPVVSWEGIYEVSTHGRIRRIAPRGDGHASGFLLGSISSYGYRQIMLRYRGRKVITFVHQIVAAAFLGPCPAGHNVNHKDEVKLNNHLENLEYLTNEENARQAHRNRVAYVRGESHGRAKYSDEEAMNVIRLLRQGYPNGKIVEMLGIGRSAVSYIKTKKRRAYLWDHIDAPSSRESPPNAGET